MRRHNSFWILALIMSLPVWAGAGENAPPEMVLQLGPVNTVEKSSFAPDDTRFAAVDGTLSLWQTQTGWRERLFEVQGTSLKSVDWSPDGTIVAAGGLAFDTGVWQGAIFLWNTRNGRLVRSWRTGKSAIDAVAFSPDGTLLATVGAGDFEGRDDRGATRLWAVTSGRLLCTLDNHIASSAELAWSPDSSKIALALGSEHQPNPTRVWSKNGGKPLEVLRDNGYSRPAFSASGKLLKGAASYAANGRYALSRRVEYRGNNQRTHLALRRSEIKNHPSDVVARLTLSEVTSRVELARDGQWLLTAGYINDYDKPLAALRVWRLSEAARTWKLVRSIEAYRHPPITVAASANGSILAIGTLHNAAVWDVNTGALHTAVPNGRWNQGLALSPDGTQLAGFFLWKLPPGGEPLRGPQLMTAKAVAFSADGARLVAGSGLLDTRTGKHTPMVIRDESDEDYDTLTGLSSASFSADGRLLATIDNTQSSRQLHIWDGVTGKFLRHVRLERPYVRYGAATFTPQGAILAIAGSEENWSQEGRVTNLPFLGLLNGATGQLIRRFESNDTYFPSMLAFSPDGQILATSGIRPWFGWSEQLAPRSGDVPSPTIRLWDVVTAKVRGSLPIYSAVPLPFAWLNNDVIVVLARDIQFWSVSHQKLLANLQILDVRQERTGSGIVVALEWVVSTPDGAFDASPGADKFLRWRVNDQLLSTPPDATQRISGLLGKALLRNHKTGNAP